MLEQGRRAGVEEEAELDPLASLSEEPQAPAERVCVKGASCSPGCSEDSLADLVTVILTTSPVRSNPSIDLIEAVFDSFHLAPGISTCSIVIVFDGYEVHPYKNEKKGRIHPEMVQKYAEYKASVRRMVDELRWSAEITCLELSQRHGFGYAVKAALKRVCTPYVLVLQHDFVFCKRVDLPALVRVLEEHPVIKYIGMLSASTERYAEGRSHGPQQHAVLPVEYFSGEPFVKLMFWYDKAHVARTEYYKNVIFGTRTCIRKGDFIEDRFGHWQLKRLRLEGMVAHHRFGTYLWYPDSGADRCVQHMQGRKFQREDVKDSLYPARLTQIQVKVDTKAHLSHDDMAALQTM